MSDNLKYYILFENHTDGMKVAKALSDNKIEYIISPTPRKLSVCCGISIMYNKNDENTIKNIVKKYNLNYKSFESLEYKVKSYYS